MNKLTVLDQRSTHNLKDDIREIKKCRVKSIGRYYSTGINREVFDLVVLTIMSAIFYVIMRKVSTYNYGSFATCAYLISYVMLLGTVALTAGCAFATGYRPYLLRRYRFERLIRQLISAKDYRQFSRILNNCSEADLSVAGYHSHNVLHELRVFCIEGELAEHSENFDVKRIKTTEDKILVELDNRSKTHFVLPLVDRLSGAPALILTDKGLALQL